MFCVLLIEHPLWGYTFRPSILKEYDNGKLTIDQLLTPKNCGEYELADYETNVVALSDTMSEVKLMNRFMRDKMMVVDFQKKFKNLPHADLIVEAVERTHYKMAVQIMEHAIPVYLKQKNYIHLYQNDRIEVLNRFCDTIPCFDYAKPSLSYSLKMVVEGNVRSIPLVKSKTSVIKLSSNPCVFVYGNTLYIFPNTTYQKIAAFFTKSAVPVPPSSVDNYFRGFITKTIASENIQAVGFEVRIEDKAPKPILSLEKDLSLQAGLRLTFRYDETEVSELDKQLKCVTMDDDYTFHVFYRKTEEEKRYIDHLTKTGLVRFNELYRCQSVEERETTNIVQFLIEHKDELSDYQLEQNLGDEEYIIEPMRLEFRFQQFDIDWFELRGTIYVGGFEIPFYKIRKNLIEGNRVYILPDKTKAILPKEWFEKFSDLVRFCDDTKEDGLFINRHHLGIAEDIAAEEKRVHLHLDEKTETPSRVQATLRPYQQIGFSWLVALYNQHLGGCLADDMGLGKTLQFLSFLQYIYPKQTASEKGNKESTPWPYANEMPSLFDMQPAQPAASTVTISDEKKKPASLVILPTSLLFNWVNEKMKFTPSLTHLVYKGEGRVRSKQIGKIFDHYNLIFTTYGTVRNDIEYLKEYQFECIIADESQNLKNATSQAFKAVMQLKSDHFFCLTGTPIENHMEDLWAQMHLANRNILGSQNYFRSFFVTPIIKQSDELRAGLLQRIIKPFILRRTKKEVATDLPEKTEQTIYCEMNEEHQKLYEKEKMVISNQIMGMLQNHTLQKNSVAALAALMRLRQLSNHPALLDENSTIPSEKMETMIERLQNLKEEGHKVLLFSSFVKHLELLEKEIQQLGFKYSKLTGETIDRQKEVERFQNDDETFCFLISLKAGGVGLNLTKADYVFLMDPWWNPAAESQAIDRAYRIGQEKNVFVYRFIMKDTLEEKIQLLQSQKKEIADHFINNNNPFDLLDYSQLENLFK